MAWRAWWHGQEWPGSVSGWWKRVENPLHACREPCVENWPPQGAAGCLLAPWLCSRRARGAAAASCAAGAGASVVLPGHEQSAVSCRGWGRCAQMNHCHLPGSSLRRVAGHLAAGGCGGCRGAGFGCGGWTGLSIRTFKGWRGDRSWYRARDWAGANGGVGGGQRAANTVSLWPPLGRAGTDHANVGTRGVLALGSAGAQQHPMGWLGRNALDSPKYPGAGQARGGKWQLWGCTRCH